LINRQKEKIGQWNTKEVSPNYSDIIGVSFRLLPSSEKSFESSNLINIISCFNNYVVFFEVDKELNSEIIEKEKINLDFNPIDFSFTQFNLFELFSVCDQKGNVKIWSNYLPANKFKCEFSINLNKQLGKLNWSPFHSILAVNALDKTTTIIERKNPNEWFILNQ